MPRHGALPTLPGSAAFVCAATTGREERTHESLRHHGDGGRDRVAASNVQDVAEILLKHQISGVPVVDTRGHVVGIVSEGDLLRRAETGTGHERSWWLKLLMGREGLATEYVREHSR